MAEQALKDFEVQRGPGDPRDGPSRRSHQGTGPGREKQTELDG